MRYIYLYGGAIGDSLVGIHLGRSLASRVPGAKLTLLSTRTSPFVHELTKELPFIEYRELIKDRPATWSFFLTLLTVPSKTIVFEPTDVVLPLWWRLILRASSWLPGSREVHNQTVGHEKPVAKGVQTIAVGREDNLFDVIVPRVLSCWGLSEGERIVPSLSRPHCAHARRPYILFHFFAANYRRSFPIEKVQPLLQEARALFPDYEFVLSATPAEKDRALAMLEGIDNSRVEANLSATELLCLLSESALCVGVASGVTHIAAHLKVPLIVFANLSDPYWLPTYNTELILLADQEHCRCTGTKGGDCTEHTPGGEVFRCLYYIKQGDIIEAMKQKLPTQQP